MKKILFAVLILFFGLTSPCDATKISGNVQKEGMAGANRVLDASTGEAISGATIKIPSSGFQVQTAPDGTFRLNTNINSPVILSVQKEGYKPFTLTVNRNMARNPLILGIEKASANTISIEADFCHLGDDNYSELSANAGRFKSKSSGNFYTKQFQLPNIGAFSDVYLVIGSITGIDTKMARDLKQNSIKSSYASPPQIYFNGNMIAEIQINGDNQEIKIPRSLIKANSANEVTIKTGKNLFTASVDYDDIEFMNLMLEVR